MPLYEYVCQKCQHGFEALVGRADKPACPACASDEVEKQLSVFATGRAASEALAAPAGCGACGDPRGPGACRFGS